MTRNQKSGLKGAALYALLGCFLLFVSYRAQTQDNDVYGLVYGKGWMTPQTGYFVAALCFAVAAYAIVLGFRGGKD